MKFSSYQSAIFNWVSAHAEGPGALLVEAVAGSGKTTTIVEAARRIPPAHSALFLAFNKSIATELSERLPTTVPAKTLNALGHGIVMKMSRNVQLDANKTRKLARAITDVEPDLEQHAASACNAVAKAKSAGMVPDMGGVTGIYRSSPDRWLDLIEHYAIDLGDTPADIVIGFAERLLRAGLEQRTIIDFDDQLYFPVAFNLPAPTFQWVIVDEAQDLSPVQHALLRKIVDRRCGKLIGVGDSRQAIYGFRGADSESLNNLRKEFNADVLPLTVSYRCPRAVVAEAQRYLPQLESAPGAPEGVVRVATEERLDSFTKGDMIVCRNTAPLIKQAYRFIKAGIPAKVQGRDIGVALVAVIKRVTKKDLGETFEADLLKWCDAEVAKAILKGEEALADSLRDKVDSILAVCEYSAPKTVEEFSRVMDTLFGDGSGVILSTVHRAKGLEADRVFILEPSLMPSKFARSEWALQQENNLLYVAITRAKRELVWLPAAAVRD